MTSLWKRLACLLVGAAIYPAVFLVSVVLQYLQTMVPPGANQVLTIRIFQTWFISGILLGIILEALGLSSFPEILRLWTNGIPAWGDPSLDIRDQEFDGVPVRIYTPKTTPAAKRKAVLYFHGGAGIVGSFASHERFLQFLAKEGDATVITVGYGLAPENPYPNQYVECLKATVFLMKHADHYRVDSSRIIISGDSFGGNVAASLCQLLAGRSDLPKVHAQALIYPVLQGMDLSLPSYQQNHRCPLLWRRLVAFFGCCYFNKPTSFVDGLLKGSHVPEAMRLKYQKWLSADRIPERFKARGYVPPEPSSFRFDPRLYEEIKALISERCLPLLAEDAVIAKLPQTFLLTCEFDVLRDDGLLYVRRLRDNRVPLEWSHVEDGMHGVLNLYGYPVLSLAVASRVAHLVAGFIRGL